MVFLGTSFFCAPETLNATSTNVDTITYARAGGGIFDRLKITNDVSYAYTIAIPEGWEPASVLEADFNGALAGGNVDFSSETVDLLRLKRREKGALRWTTLYEKRIERSEDFYGVYIDPYGKSGVQYEYAITPVLDGIEGNSSIIEVQSQFRGCFIADTEACYGTQYNLALGGAVKSQNPQIVETLDSRYPFVISNSQSNFYSSSFSAFFFVPSWSKQQNIRYRAQIMEWLQNRKAKILKCEDGRIWMIRLSSSPTLTPTAHAEMPSVDFEWVEIGDWESTQDLADSGLTSVEV